jgi:hypothetical protein
MLAEGLLATADVERVAEAHVRVYEAMSGGGAAGGRYICYDHVVRRGEEFAELQRQLGLPITGVAAASRPGYSDDGDVGGDGRFALCNGKLARLVSSRRRCTYDVYYPASYD